MSDVERFDILLHNYFEGLATSAEVAELDQLLLADQTLVQRASEQCLLHRQVFELLAEQRLHEIMDGLGGGAQTVPSAMRSIPDGCS